MFQETHRLCLEEECPSLSHLKVGWGKEGWKSQPFYPFFLFHLCLSPSPSSLGLFVSLCPSLFLPLLGIISTPSHNPTPAPTPRETWQSKPVAWAEPG